MWAVEGQGPCVHYLISPPKPTMLLPWVGTSQVVLGSMNGGGFFSEQRTRMGPKWLQEEFVLSGTEVAVGTERRIWRANPGNFINAPAFGALQV